MKVKEEEIIFIKLNIDKLTNEFIKSQGYNFGNAGNRDYSNETLIQKTMYSIAAHSAGRWTYYKKDIIYLTSDELTEENGLKTIYDNIKKRKVSIQPDHKILFSKSSAYPRHRLANYTSNKRTIKKETADWIIIPNTGFLFEEKAETFYRDKNTGTIYKLDTGDRYYIRPGLIDYLYNNYADFSYDPKNKSIENFVSDYVVKHINKDLEEINLSKFVIDSKIGKEDFITLFEKYKEKVIIEDQLDSYINSGDTTITLDEEQFNMINNLLKSTDPSSVSLGMRMLTTVDSNKSFIALAILLLFNIKTMCRNKEWNTVGIKAIRSKFNFIDHNRIFTVRDEVFTLNILTKNFVKTDEEREMIRKFGLPMINGIVEAFIKAELKGIDFINKYEIIID